jgi:electron transport complex protein RnfD
MRDVAIALLPTLAFGIYHFGLKALLLTVLSVAACAASEALFEVAAKKPITVFDFSAVVTGLIIAVNLPPTAPWYFPILAGVFAIIFVKMLFGGLGQNFMNPALAGRVFLVISFGAMMNDFSGNMNNLLVDGISGATPLAQMRDGVSVDLLPLLIGNHGGCIGEVSAVAILLGGAYLVVRRVINVRIPLTYICSTIAFMALIMAIQGRGGEITVHYLAAQALSGGLLVGAVFMATDYVTSPITSKGQWIYGLILGLLTALFRTVGSTAEGVSYSIIITNLLVPIIEKTTAPRPFGCERTKGVAK